MTRFSAALALTVVCVAAKQPATDAATLRVWNHLDKYVTVSIDGAYGCNTAGGTVCTIPITDGQHQLVARTSDGESISRTVVLAAGDQYKWCLYYTSDPNAEQECTSWES